MGANGEVVGDSDNGLTLTSPRFLPGMIYLRMAYRAAEATAAAWKRLGGSDMLALPQR